MKIYPPVFNFIFFQSSWWSALWGNTAVQTVLKALGVLAFGWIVKTVLGELETLRKIRSKFSITGIWIGTCKLPSYPPTVEAIEIYRFVIKREQVAFTFFNYLPNARILKYKGNGVYRGNMFSAFYYMPNKTSFESGVFVVRLSGVKLRGVYAQYDPKADERLLVSPKQQFELMRIQLPFWLRLRMRFGRPPYEAYAEVEKLYKQTIAEYPVIPKKTKAKRGTPPLAAVTTPPS